MDALMGASVGGEGSIPGGFDGDPEGTFEGGKVTSVVGFSDGENVISGSLKGAGVGVFDGAGIKGGAFEGAGLGGGVAARSPSIEGMSNCNPKLTSSSPLPSFKSKHSERPVLGFTALSTSG